MPGAAADAPAPVRKYTLDDVFHGMSIGKNGDLFRRLSRQAEGTAAQLPKSLSAVLGLFGRPYASWDVYPVVGAGRGIGASCFPPSITTTRSAKACAAHVGRYSYDAQPAAGRGHTSQRGLQRLAQRVTERVPGTWLSTIHSGWERTDAVA